MFADFDRWLAHTELNYELFMLEATKYIIEQFHLPKPYLLDLWTSPQCKRAMKAIANIGFFRSRAHWITYLLTGHKTELTQVIEQHLFGG